MKTVQLNQVSRHFGRHYALHKISATLHAGEVTALMGANGAGKTTLLNILAGIEEPSSGNIKYDSWSWPQFSKHGRRLVGWVSHAPLLYPDLTGMENLTFYAQMYNLKNTHELCTSWLKQVGLTEAAHKRVEVYSRGMIQRLTIARALLHDPSLLLLDEPLTGLDRQARQEMSELFLKQKEQGKILVLSTHDLITLSTICDRMFVLRKGRLLHESTPQDKEDLIATYEQFA